MNVVPTIEIPDVLRIEPDVFEDERGFLYESYNRKTFFDKTEIQVEFVQDNHSRSRQHVLRGLHYQIQQPQGKLVRVAVGAVFDVAVDLRKSSHTFGHWTGCILSAESKKQIWIPPGFAHGFLVISDIAEVLYKTTDYYTPEHQRCLLWNDPDLAIAWPLTAPPVLSAKDQTGDWFKQADIFP